MRETEKSTFTSKASLFRIHRNLSNWKVPGHFTHSPKRFSAFRNNPLFKISYIPVPAEIRLKMLNQFDNPLVTYPIIHRIPVTPEFKNFQQFQF
jgi:hypothetical protein